MPPRTQHEQQEKREHDKLKTIVEEDRESQSKPEEHRAGENRPQDQAGGAEHSGGDADDDRNP
ncbi:MAG TPA: hypothetical protein VFV23_07625 [Verrucomicrobiae bacterium]|nr:hypothetical protein [Verrucomicrobiae bacterium]